MVTHHASFIPMPPQLLDRLCRAIHTYVAANRPVTGSAAALFPGKEACFRTVTDGGIALVDLRAQILALQAKVLGRLLQPEQLAWKGLLRLPPLQEHSLAGSADTRRDLSAPPALLAAWEIPSLLQLSLTEAAGPGARTPVHACLPQAAASPPPAA